MAVLGQKLVATSGQWIRIDPTPNNQRAIVLGAFVAPTAIWVTRLGVYARRAAGATGIPRIWLGIYALDSGGNPDSELAWTIGLPVTISAGGGDASGTLATPLSGLAARLDAGQRFAIAVKVETEAVEFASFGVPTTHWQRTVGTIGVPPTNPFTASSTVTANDLTLYAEYIENDPPTADQDSPLPGASVSVLAPILQGSFLDANATTATDKMSAYALEVRRQSDQALQWNGASALFTATADERAFAQYARVYAGTTLVSGLFYEWRARVADDAGAWSNWTSWSVFSVNPLGQVDVSTGSPSGKIDTDSNLTDFTGRWWHPTALATNAVEVRVVSGLRGRAPRIVRRGVEVAKTVASSAMPGTLFTVNDNESGVFAGITGANTNPLQSGSYGYQIRGRSTDGQWSPWSDIREFSVNAVPTRPANLQPPAGAASTSRPLLEWLIDDPDDDDVYGVDDDSEIEVSYGFIGSSSLPILVGTFTTTNYDAAKGKGFLQTTATHFPSTNLNYFWRVRGRDLSAGAEGYGQWSLPQVTTYLDGPAVTMSAPASGQTLTTSVPTVSFSIGTGVISRYQVKFYQRGAAAPIRASPELVLNPNAASASYTVPAGWLVNGGLYDVEVTVWNAGNVKGVSLRRPFQVFYTQPIPPNAFTAAPGLAQYDFVASPSVILLAWEPSQYPPAEFAGYIIRRRYATQDRSQATVLRTLTAAGQIRWIDYWAPSNTLMVYGLSQLRRVGAEILESPIVEVAVELHRTTHILCSAYDPALRFPLAYVGADISFDSNRPKASYLTWGSNGKPLTVRTPATYEQRTARYGLTLVRDSRGELYEHVAALEAVLKSGHPLALMPERQEEMMWCEVGDWSGKRGRSAGSRTYTLSLNEIDFTPGSQGGS